MDRNERQIITAGKSGDKLRQSGNGFLLVGAQQAWFRRAQIDESDPLLPVAAPSRDFPDSAQYRTNLRWHSITNPVVLQVDFAG
jgi:hypothetical protein